MYHITPVPRVLNKRAFTLVEVMTATFIALYTITAAMASYVMFWMWWHETNPEIEAERLARIAISSVIYGKIDPTAGAYSVGSTSYTRRSGIAQATKAPTFPSAQAINFSLEPDSSNCRSYYLGVDPVSGQNVVYYKDSGNAITKINATAGITDLIFSNVINGVAMTNMVTVTAIVDWNILGTGSAPHHVYVIYSQPVYLRNVH